MKSSCLSFVEISRTRPQFLARLALPRLIRDCCLYLSLVSAPFSGLSSPQSTAPPKTSLTIHGTVINSVTHEPVGRALVFTSDSHLGTLTDAQGHFEFTLSDSIAPDSNSAGSAAPSSNVVAAANGSAALSASVGSLTARKPGFLAMTPGQGGKIRIGADDELKMTLVPEALIAGKVVLPSSEPAQQVQVELYRRTVSEGRAHWVQMGSTAARANGAFRFADLPAGTYKVLTAEYMDRDPLTGARSGQLYGYPPMYYPGASNFAAATLIHLTAGETFDAELSLKPQPYYPVKISVANASAQFGLQISVLKEGQPGPGFSLGYNPEDQTIEGALPSGAYLVQASGEMLRASGAPGIATGIAAIAVQDAPVSQSMVLTAGQSITVKLDEEFTAPENPDQQGFIINRNVRVYQQVNVMLHPAADFLSLRPAMARSRGKDAPLVLDSVQPGEYWATFNPARGYVASATSGGVDLLHHPLVVAAGGAAPTIEVTLRDDTAQISGTVDGVHANISSGFGNSAASLDPLSNLRSGFSNTRAVYLIPLPDGPGTFVAASVNPDGSFASIPIPPGSYRILAFDSAQDQLEYRNAEAMRAYDSKGQVIRLVPGQKEQIKVQLIATE